MLRDYQTIIKSEINALPGNVLGVMPTGAGKTRTMAAIAAELDRPNIAIAHRQELVSQISLAFAGAEIHHRIIAPRATIDAIVKVHLDILGKSFYRANGAVAVAGVDTLIRRGSDPFLQTVERWQMDEAHHVRADNKWGRAVAMFPGVHGVGWTATPTRTDRKSLKRGKGGLFDSLALGPSMRDLIGRGYLTPYELYGLPQAIDVSRVHVGANGELVQSELSAEARHSRITGDIVEHYLRLAPGKRGVTFAVDVGMAIEHAHAFRAAGVPAAVLEAKTPLAERIAIIRAFRNGELMQVCNVDILGEGFDLPAIEVVSFGRPTMSFGLYVQQFGRVLRLMDGKLFGIVLDHVGNVARHGLPDAARVWTLDTPDRRAMTPREVAIQVCGNPACMRAYEGYEPQCPFCGWERDLTRAERERPEVVAGDLELYTPEMLAQLRGEVNRIAGPPQIPRGLPPGAVSGLVNRWEARQEAQGQLAAEIDAWAGVWVNGRGESIRAAYRRFHATFGMDPMSALTQTGPQMAAMIERVRDERP